MKRKLVVREAAWIDAIVIARIVRLHAEGKHDSEAWAARKLFRMALALLEETRLNIEMKP